MLFVSIGSQRPDTLHRNPASFARDSGRFLANGLGTKVPPGCHGERGREGETGTLFAPHLTCSLESLFRKKLLDGKACPPAYKSSKLLKLSSHHKISRLNISSLRTGDITNFISLFSFLANILHYYPFLRLTRSRDRVLQAYSSFSHLP